MKITKKIHKSFKHRSKPTSTTIKVIPMKCVCCEKEINIKKEVAQLKSRLDFISQEGLPDLINDLKLNKNQKL